MAIRTKKTKKETEPYFKELVEVYFKFCREKFDEDPSFDGSAPRDLKNIISTLRQRATSKGIEWTLPVASLRLSLFLEYAFKDKWLSQNWLLFNLNRQKDKIFYNIRLAQNYSNG